MPYSKKIESLSDTEKHRMLCVMLNSKLTETDWQAATKQFGSVSVASMQRMWYATMANVRKLTAAGSGEGGAAGGDESGSVAKPIRSGKRNAQGETGSTSTKKGRGKKKTDADDQEGSKVADSKEADPEVDVGVKMEEDIAQIRYFGP